MHDIKDFPWQLDVNPYSLDTATVDLLFACDMLQENHMSLRRCEKESLIPKSTIHKFIKYGKLKQISFELYKLCIKQLQWNQKNKDKFINYNRKRT